MMIEPAIERAIASYKVAHITFYVTPHPDMEGVYNLFSVARGGEPRFIDVAWTFEEANQMLAAEIKELETRLEAKRDKPPTTKQIMFLFREKIPIPVDLTWGEASDLIEERLENVVEGKEAKRAARFNGFTVGMRVIREFTSPRGEHFVTRGEITKLTQGNQGIKYAYIKRDGTKNEIHRFPLDFLQKDESEVGA